MVPPTPTADHPLDPEVLHDTFLGVPPEECTFEDSGIILVRAPYDRSASYGTGSRGGPAAIMAASTQVECFDLELGRETCDLGIHTPPMLTPSALGPEDMVDRVEAACRGPHAREKFVFLLGGEHSVTLGAARAASRRFPGLSFLQIDAHLDLRESYEGSRFSHASVGRRLLELGSLTQVGVRTGCPEELEVIQQRGLRPIWGWDIHRSEDEDWIAQVLDQLGPQVYVTLDVDGLDPSVMPATGTPVPGGLGWYQALKLLRAVGEARQVVACDLCELSPIPGQHASDFTAALLAYKMMGYFVR